MHLYREGHRQRSRILYVFRSPGGVRVGRGALDPDVLREIEAQYPDIAFDWKDVREHQQHIEISPEPRRRKPPKREEAVAAAAPDVQAPHPHPHPHLHHLRHLRRPLAQYRRRLKVRLPTIRSHSSGDGMRSFVNASRRRTSDPVRQEALMALTERLNPAAWTDADQIAAGLQQASEALERLSRVFSRRRRRTRRRSNDSRPASPGPTQSDS